VTGQDLQNSNLYAHANASDRHGSFYSARSGLRIFASRCCRPARPGQLSAGLSVFLRAALPRSSPLSYEQ
jgi:hypothetical protein